MALSIRRSLQGVLLALSMVSIAGIAVDFFAVRALMATLRNIETDEMRHLTTLKTISDAYAVSIVDATHKVGSGEFSWAEGLKQVSESMELITKSWDSFKQASLDAEERLHASQYESLMSKAIPILDRLISILKAEDRKALEVFRTSVLYSAIDPLTEKIDSLVKAQMISAKQQLEKAEQNGSFAIQIQTAIALFMAMITALGFLFVNNRVIKPINQIGGAMVSLAEGDTDIQLPAAEQKTEIGEMARAVAVFLENAIERQRLERQARSERQRESARQAHVEKLIRTFRGAMGTIGGTLDGQLHAMQTSSASLNRIAEQASNDAASAEEASSESTGNIAAVAGAAGELTAASREISTQVHKASESVTQTMNVARHANEDILALASLADRIGAIVDMISSIAEQTNMLALNATIEAARAGDAGRSFAVVASEVKTLAGQTAKATQEISAQVLAIQTGTQQAVQLIQTITGSVAEIEGRTTAIAAAVEQQEASTHEISRSITLASNGSNRVAENVAGMSQSVMETSEEARLLRQTSEHLSAVAGDLSQSVESFLNSVTEDVHNRRQATRKQIHEAAVVTNKGKRHITEILDASETGIRMVAVEGMLIGEQITIEASNGDRMKGRPVWITNGQAGIAMDTPVPHSLFEVEAKAA